MSNTTEQMLKGMAWENAKGAIRASVHLAGCSGAHTAEQEKHRRDQWREFDKLAEEFIKHIEDHGLCE